MCVHSVTCVLAQDATNTKGDQQNCGIQELKWTEITF